MHESLRKLIAEAIGKRFNKTYEEHGIDYDPDTCHEAADDVIAVLVTQLTGQLCTAKRAEGIIGLLAFELDNQRLF